MSKTWQTVLLAIVAWLVRKWLKPEQLDKVDILTEIRRKELDVDEITHKLADLAADANFTNWAYWDELNADRMSLNRKIAALRRELKLY